jgi:uncharacterized protein
MNKRKVITMNKVERRTFDIELRREDGESRKMTGHAAVFNEETRIGSYFREKIAPGAFTESVQKDDIRALFNHDANFVLGRNRAGTLKLSEDDKGLAIEIDPPDTSFARDLAVSMGRGDITQMSFAFQVLGDEWEEGEKDGLDLRTITKVKLYDVSPVTYPAYDGTDIALHSRDAFRASLDKPTVTLHDYSVQRAKIRLQEIAA